MACGFTKFAEFFKLDELASKSVETEQKFSWHHSHSAIYTGGIIRPMINGKVDTVEAIGFHDGKVLAVGTEEHVKAKMNGLNPTHTRLPDGHTLLPGLIEPHLHIVAKAIFTDWNDFGPFEGQDLRSNYDLEYLTKSIENAKSKFGVFESHHWILGTGLDPSLMKFDVGLEGALNQLISLKPSVLDSMESKHPIFIIAASGHTAYVNTEAMKKIYHALLNIKLREKFGSYEEYEKSVVENGGLQEAENMTPAFLAIPVTQLHISGLFKNLNKFIDEALSRGITMMYDAASILPSIAVVNVYILLYGDKIRIGYAKLCQSLADVEKLPEYKPMDKFKNNFAGSVKIISDGSNQGLTGYQKESYKCVASHPCGVFNFPPDGGKITSDSEFAKMVKGAIDKGWPLMIHANGNKAIEFTLDAYELALGGESGLNKRHRIEHCSLVNKTALDRIKLLGISPSFLIGHVGYWGYVFRNAIFEEKAELLDVCQSAIQKGICITLHSDSSVTPVGPLRFMEQACTRIMEKDPLKSVLNEKERISREEALKVITCNAAWQCHAEKWVGSLEEEKMADYIILNEDPITRASPVGIRNIPVLETWVGGRRVYLKK